MRAAFATEQRVKRIFALIASSVLATSLAGCGGGSGGGNANGSGPPTTPTQPPPNPSSPTSSGLDARPSNTTCVAFPSAAASITLQRYTTLSFSKPLALLQAPGVNTYWYVLEQAGYVRRFAASDATSATTVLDITDRVESGGEAGLLGIAFHPSFPNDRRVFISYTTRQGAQLISRISSFVSNDAGATIDPNSELILLTVDQPADNHNGGHIGFGPDGYLYIGFGDGDPWGENGNGQRLTTLLGKLLRIDVNVDAATRYGVPTTNPFFDPANAGDKCPAASREAGNCPEIYAWGFRNPWRWNFDRATGDLWLADVGQNRYEEVNLVTRGGNYGWRCREGAHDYASGSTPACATAATIDPLIEYGRTDGQSITGGYVYRGTQNTQLAGRYLFGDFGSGRIWAWIPENTTSRVPTLLLESGLNISSFGQGNDGELYVVDHGGGTLQQIVFQESAAAPIPATLSATGCVNPSNPAQAASGLIPYEVNAPFWSDGATKERWIGLPDGQTITVGTNGDWEFPNGTVLMKHFKNSTRFIETRLFMRHPDGHWGGFTYEWNAQQTDATLVQGGATRTIDGQTWSFPSEAQCIQCHTAAAGHSLGLETAQLNKDFTYAQTGRVANQLATLSAINTLTPPIANAAAEPTLPNPQDAAAPLANRARAYLHTNCSQCHRQNGTTQSTMDLRYATAFSATNTCNVAPQLGTLELGTSARLIVPGDPDNSVLINRMNRRDVHAMPPVGSAQVDAAGVELLRQWVAALTGC